MVVGNIATLDWLGLLVSAIMTPTDPRNEAPLACILSMSHIADDPRVRRQGETLYEAGWRVVGCGMPGNRSALPDWPILSGATLDPSDRIDVYPPPLPKELVEKAGGDNPTLGAKMQEWAVKAAGKVLTKGKTELEQFNYRLFSIRWRQADAHQIYWTWSSNTHDIYRCARLRPANLWIANDWHVLPIATRLADELGGVVLYDTHELASSEYAQISDWRRHKRPMTMVMEGVHIKRAVAVSSISDGISRRLQQLYSLPELPTTVRNTSAYQKHPFRPCGERIQVMYHGVVVEGRGLEMAVQSLALWPKEFYLVYRGPISDAFKEKLLKMASDLGVSDRFELAAPVATSDLISAANTADIGLCVPPGHSLHNILSLPNKVFEYMMAGLCLALTPLPEHKKLVSAFGVGFVTPGESAEALAKAISSLTREQIDAAKRNALKAAEKLCWENESRVFLDLCRKAIGKNAKVPLAAAG